MASHDVVHYRWQGVALLRATTRPGPADVPHALDPHAPLVLRAWLGRVWQHQDVRNTVRAASPALSQAVDAITRGAQSRPRQIRRTALSMVSYLLRWQHRPTPFGYFAGTASVTAGAAPRVRWGAEHQVVRRADGEWLADIVRRLQEHRALLDRLTVVANNTAQTRGDRLVASGPPADGRTHLMAPVEVSLRCSRPVEAALQIARTPIRCQDLREELTDRFPAGAGEKIDGLLWELVVQNLLITSLGAPMTVPDALEHVCGELKKVDAHSLPHIGDLARELYDLHDDLSGRELVAPAADLCGVTDRMTALSDVTPTPVLIDTALDCDIQVPEQVIAEAQVAVAALCQVSPLPYGHRQWRDYHRRFRDRYGVGAVIPVLDLVADSGLGWPAGYIGSDRGKAPGQLGDRDDLVMRLVQETLMEGREELVLTAKEITALAKAAGLDEPLFAQRTEVAFEVRAASTSSLARGAFQLAITGVPRPASSMAGRFMHLLPAAHQAAWASTYRSTVPGASTAQLSFGPRRRRNENVARTPALLDLVVPLAEHPTEGRRTIDVDDLAITAEARRFHLIQVSTGIPVDIRIPHALEAGVQTPPLARFLAEIAEARCAVYKPFDFGAASRLPYLPRVRYRRTLLAPARWLLAADGLPGRSASAAEWETAFADWRTRLHVPDRVALVEHDQGLPLDLTHPVHRHLLRSRVEDVRHVELHEAPDPDAYGWIGRAHEILLPLQRARPATARFTPATRPVQPTPRQLLHLTGSGRVLRAHLHAHPARYDEILDRHLPHLIAKFDQAPPWWFSRQREVARPEAGQHLALFLHLPEGTYATAAEHLSTWAEALHRARLASDLTLATYQPQTGRYGHGTAMDAAHRLFAADSAAAIAQIRLAAHADAPALHSLAAASVLDLARLLAPTADRGMRWLIKHVPHEHGRLDRGLRDEVLHLAVAGPDSVRRLGGGELAQKWAARARAVREYRKVLAKQRDPLSVARSLFHQHHVRAMGVGPDAETTTLRLARTAALRHTQGAAR
ncbi:MULTISPECIES: lantibiotic dehydratase [unclassified Streptomyces]|uniref:lantibiotic dehydratase n=1 Tax=unclassified Streptomyces TaxID=2593676 RepID=UPI002DDA6EA5|nr:MULTISPECIES: lantibiotic dehydratase [unclassified Streptomyces]WSA91652.1 lantibiotic dehydratase [Streptomyces sp. NBC_01795]WSS15702.1 lantibiotic dehydratase [Streptomyces sp. NBC_01186]WSS44542.1 lantibiotic dehydratase [Streptomyces sp. NBC_01187]